MTVQCFYPSNICPIPNAVTYRHFNLGDPFMRKGFTIIELLVVVSIIGLLVAILLPAIGKARDSALLTQSQSNLRAIGQASANYGADFQDRQWTAVADDLGVAPNLGDCTKFSEKRCSSQLVLGLTGAGSSVGFFIPQAKSCGIQGGSATCDVAKAYWPCDFDMAGTGNFGSWRLVNAKSFNKYVGSRFYDPIFYSPKDKVTLTKAATFLETGNDFAGPLDASGVEVTGANDLLQSAILSTYCWSPAAMWGPDVLSQKKGFQDPKSIPSAFRSPAASQAAYPDLKTRCMEHQWLQNKPTRSDTADGGTWDGGGPNPDPFCPKIRGKGGMPWFFNQGYMSAPATVFFDGHIAQLSVAEAVDSYNRIEFTTKNEANVVKGSFFAGSGGGGNTGFTAAGTATIPTMPKGYSWSTYDNGASFKNKNVSYHVLTANGILGRDTIGQH